MGKGIFLNIDINSVVYPFLDEIAKRPEVNEELLHAFIDQYLNTQITDISLCVFCQYSNTPSVVFTDAYEKYEQETENGVKVDYKDIFGGIYKLWKEHELDVYDIWFKRIKTRGLSSWLSVRMNDCHEPDEETSFLRGDFFYYANSKNMFIGPKYGYFRNCFDYGNPLVRHMMLAYISEQLERYDVDGLELDFLREIYCFDYIENTGAYKIMNDFMREVKEIVENIEKKRAHKIKILARVMRDIEQNMTFGFDIKTWVSEGLVDILAIGPRWATCDSDMPVNEWKRLCGEIPVYAGVEVLVCRQTEKAIATAEVVRGFAAQYFSAKADKLYLFNYFQNPLKPVLEWQEIYNGASGEELFSLPRRHVVTYQDLYPAGYEPYKPFPREIEPNEFYEFSVSTGIIENNRPVRLILGFEESETLSGSEVFLNDEIHDDMAITEIESFDSSEGRRTKNGYIDIGTQLICLNGFGSGKERQHIKVRNRGDKAIKLMYAELAVEKAPQVIQNKKSAVK